MRPFSDGDVSSTFEGVKKSIRAEIDSLSNDYVLNAAPSELEAFYVQKGTIDPLVLHSEGLYIEKQNATKIDVSHDFMRGGYGDGRPILVPGTTLRIAIPFDGDPKLWRIRASTFSLSGYPDIEVANGVVVLPVTFLDDSADSESLRRQIDHDVESLSDAVAYLAKDVSEHNSALQQLVATTITRKRDKALAATSAVAALGIPIKRADSQPSYAVPAKRRPSPVSRPAVATGKYEPEPVLAEAEYAHILKVMRSMALVVERNPRTFSSLDEESIRDHFLLQLNGHYDGGATGETFNAAGKTDILIRSGNRNAFVAECKIWRGAKQFNAAIDQLLTYLTWRDSKTALLVFNKNRDSTAVTEKMHEAVLARPEYQKLVSRDPSGDARYVLVKPDEPGREIILTTQLYDIPDLAGS